MSLFSQKSASTGAIQPWASVFDVGKSIRNFYTPLGDVTLTGANTISTLLDGPEKIVRYGALTLGDGTAVTSLTASNRCKGLTIICDSLTVRNNATLNMTGKGPRVAYADDVFFPFIDFRIPNKITLSSSIASQASALTLIRSHGLALWDQGTWQSVIAALYGVNWGVSVAGEIVLLTASGCGAAVNGVYATSSQATGNTGSAGVNGAPGGGGSGGVNQSAGPGTSHRSGKGNPYGGGCGSGGVSHTAANPCTGCDTSEFSGPGGHGGFNSYWDATATYPFPGESRAAYGYGAGGAGNPGGKGMSANALAPAANGSDGVGGKLVIICFGQVSVQSGGKIEANGMPGGTLASYAGGGGSGGGHVSIITPTGMYSNLGTVQCAGGAAGSPYGGAGGLGCVVVKTFADMGSAWI